MQSEADAALVASLAEALNLYARGIALYSAMIATGQMGAAEQVQKDLGGISHTLATLLARVAQETPRGGNR